MLVGLGFHVHLLPIRAVGLEPATRSPYQDAVEDANLGTGGRPGPA